MPNHLVFASYAQVDRDKYLEKFIDELTGELVQAVAGISPDTAVFFDRLGVKAGDRWSEVIVTAANQARVLLCLMSPTYFTREWCGRELAIFLQRYEQLSAPAKQNRYIFPVWWRRPATPRRIPKKLGEFNYRDARFPPAYDTDGIRGLARRGTHVQFKAMIDSLVSHVAQTLESHFRLPDGKPIAEILDIPNAFNEQQPYDVQLLALTSGGDAWRPTHSDFTIAEAADQVARRLGTFVHAMETGPGLEQRLDKATSDKQLLLVVADAAAQLDHTLVKVNALNVPNLILLLVDTGMPAVGASAWVGKFPAGAIAKAQANGLLATAGTGMMSAEMERLVDEARRQFQSTEPLAKAEDAQLAEDAREHGIDVTIQPNLSVCGTGVRQ